MDWASLPGSVINCCNDSAIVPIEAGLVRRPRDGYLQISMAEKSWPH